VKDFVAKLVDKQNIRANKKTLKTVLESFNRQWPDRALPFRRLMREFDAWLRSNTDLTEKKLKIVWGNC
jgi:hypothetical protein